MSARSLALVGLNHRTAPVALREQVAFTEDQLPGALQALADLGLESYILSTCNRTELCLVADGSASTDDLLHFLEATRGVPRPVLESHSYGLSDEEVVHHLFRVASGLDSMVLGEAQILGQVRAAFDAATRVRTVGRMLGRVLPLAIEVGKRARTETRIGRGALSPSSVAVDLAKQALGDLEGKTVAVIGAGDAGRATARSLVAAGVQEILVVNRSPERAEDLARDVGGRPTPYADRISAIERADIVISSTDAGEHVVSAPEIGEVMARRAARPLLCVDIAVPRDFDPAVAEIASVLLYNVDDLEAVCAAKREEREREVSRVEAIIEEGMADYRAWHSAQQVIPTIGALYQRAESIRRRELDRTLGRLAALSPEERDMIEAMTSSIVRKLLHDPVAALRARNGAPDARELARLTRELFALPSEEIMATPGEPADRSP